MKVTNLFTEKDREVFDRIDRDCIAMHVVPPPKTFLRLDVVGPDGEPLETYIDRAHSWVRNYYQAVRQSIMFGIGTIANEYGEGKTGYRNGQNGLATNQPGYGHLTIGSEALGDSNNGIVVGTGTSAEDFESYALSSRVTHGTTAGKLSYGAQSHALSYNPTTKKWANTLTRIFNNNSGGAIIITEVGIQAYFNDPIIMYCRDLLAEPKTVPNAGQLTVTYTIEMTFPA